MHKISQILLGLSVNFLVELSFGYNLFGAKLFIHFWLYIKFFILDINSIEQIFELMMRGIVFLILFPYIHLPPNFMYYQHRSPHQHYYCCSLRQVMTYSQSILWLLGGY